MHEIAGKRMNRYHELGQYAFGKLRACISYLVLLGTIQMLH